MKYIIEDIEIKGKPRTYSYLIEADKIVYMNHSLKRLRHLRLHIEPFKLFPGKIMHSESLEHASTSEIESELFKCIERGCTTVISLCTVQYRSEISEAVATMRERLKISALDYVIGVTIPFTQLTPSLVRLCKREKIPLLYVQIDALEQFNRFAWEWIREALQFYRVVIIPKFCEKKMNEKERELALATWQTVTRKFQISTTKPFSEYEPYDRISLQKIGLYPLKSVLIGGSDVDYYLAELQEQENEQETIKVVVLRGKVLKAGENIFYQTGFGREIVIFLPGRFQELASSSLNVYYEDK